MVYSTTALYALPRGMLWNGSYHVRAILCACVLASLCQRTGSLLLAGAPLRSVASTRAQLAATDVRLINLKAQGPVRRHRGLDKLRTQAGQKWLPLAVSLRGGAEATVSSINDSSKDSNTSDRKQLASTNEDLPHTGVLGSTEHDSLQLRTGSPRIDAAAGSLTSCLLGMVLAGQIAGLALPALLSLLVDPILSIVDTAYVGRGLGPIDLAALGKIVQQMYVIAFVLGAGLQAGLLTQAPSILTIMGAGSNTALFPPAAAYLKTRALAAPAVLLIMVSEGVFRGHSNTRASAITALSAAAANVVLDPIFMFGLSMGISGAAGATACAQYLAVAVYGTMLWRGGRNGKMEVPFLFSRETRERRRRAEEEAVGGGGRAAPVDPLRLLASVVSANAAMLLRTTSLMACWAVATAVATRMSAATVGAHQVSLSLWLLFALVAEAPSIAAQVLGARHIGRGELATARSMARRVITLTLMCSGLLASTLLATNSILPRVFTSDAEVLKRLAKLLPLLAFQQPLVAVTLVVEGLLVGAGQFRWLGASTACTSALSACLILAVGSRAPHWDVLGIWGGITVMFVGRLATAVWRLMDRKQGPYWVPRSVKAAAPLSPTLPLAPSAGAAFPEGEGMGSGDASDTVRTSEVEKNRL